MEDVTQIQDTITAMQWLIGILLSAIAALVTAVIFLYKEKDKAVKFITVKKDEMYEKLYKLSLNNLSILEGIKEAINSNTEHLKTIPSTLKEHIDIQTSMLTQIIEKHGAGQNRLQ